MLGFMLLGRVAHKIAYYTVATIPFAIVFFLCRGYFTAGWPPLPQFVAFVISLIMAFLLGYFIEVCIGLIGFWFLEVSSLLFVYMLLNFFLSGHMFPLDMLNTLPWHGPILFSSSRSSISLTFPAAVFLGKVPADRLWMEIGIEFAWLIFFILLARWCMHAGLKRYSGYGG